MIEFSSLHTIRHFFLIPLRWRIRQILLYFRFGCDGRCVIHGSSCLLVYENAPASVAARWLSWLGLLCFLRQGVCMREEYNSVLSILLRLIKSASLADTDISVKPKYQPDILARPTYQSISILINYFAWLELSICGLLPQCMTKRNHAWATSNFSILILWKKLWNASSVELIFHIHMYRDRLIWHFGGRYWHVGHAWTDSWYWYF